MEILVVVSNDDAVTVWSGKLPFVPRVGENIVVGDVDRDIYHVKNVTYVVTGMIPEPSAHLHCGKGRLTNR